MGATGGGANAHPTWRGFEGFSLPHISDVKYSITRNKAGDVESVQGTAGLMPNIA